MFLFKYKKGKLKIDGSRMDYIEFGKGKPLLIIPGLNDGLRAVGSFALINNYLHFRNYNSFRIILIGRREPLPKDFTTKDMADDYAKAMSLLDMIVLMFWEFQWVGL